MVSWVWSPCGIKCKNDSVVDSNRHMNKHTWKHNCPRLDLKVSSLKTLCHKSSRSSAPYQSRPGAEGLTMPCPEVWECDVTLVSNSLVAADWDQFVIKEHAHCGGCVIFLLCSVRCAHQALHYHGEIVNCMHRIRRGKHEGEDETLRWQWEVGKGGGKSKQSLVNFPEGRPRAWLEQSRGRANQKTALSTNQTAAALSSSLHINVPVE